MAKVDANPVVFFCAECRTPVRQRGTQYTGEISDRIRSEQVCFNCAFWREKAEHADQFVRIDGDCYHVAEEGKPSLGSYGFGGREFVIEMSDGRRVLTHNLWHNGRIPSHFRVRLPDNARFVRKG